MKIKNECNIVSDLLLGYADDILTEDSKWFVNEHIQTCDKCKEKLNNIVNDIKCDKIENQEAEIDYLKKVKKKISKKNKIIIGIGIILTVIIALNIIIFIRYNINVNEIDILLENNITEEVRKQIENMIYVEDNEAKVTYISPEEACKQAIKTFENDGYEEAAKGFNIEEGKDKFPASYIIKTDIEHIDKIEKALADFEGIRTIRSDKSLNPYELLIRDIIIFFQK